jgi:hypothetical protein
MLLPLVFIGAAIAGVGLIIKDSKAADKVTEKITETVEEAATIVKSKTKTEAPASIIQNFFGSEFEDADAMDENGVIDEEAKKEKAEKAKAAAAAKKK